MRGIALCADGVRNCRVTAWEAWERPLVSEKLMVHGCILLLRLDMVKRAAKRCRPSRRLWDGTWCAGTEVEPQKIIQSCPCNRLTELYHATESNNGRYRVFLKVTGEPFSDKVRMSTDKNLWSVLQVRFSFLVSLSSLIKLQMIEGSSLPLSSTCDKDSHKKAIMNAPVVN
ncbi:hypothetical protein ALC53_07578 [Atta colombica]|uniref:Uncharacterized protein n=1 Tax=Atta colombica TaxID=520822 RepID=A0A195BCI8_9HYME|nr:hypothetical protein ALC53_07578 [Atta colombica]